MSHLDNWTEQTRSLTDSPPREVGKLRFLVERLCNSLADSATGAPHQADIAQFRANVDRLLQAQPEKLSDDFSNGASWGALAAAVGFLGFYQNQFQHREHVAQTLVGEILSLLESGARRSADIADVLGRDRSQISRALKRLVKEHRVAPNDAQSDHDRRGRWYRIADAPPLGTVIGLSSIAPGAPTLDNRTECY